MWTAEVRTAKVRSVEERLEIAERIERKVETREIGGISIIES